MAPHRIILLRHGESQGNVDPTVFRYTPDYKVSLTELGRMQSAVAGDMLNNIISDDETIRIYCSPYYRTRETLKNVQTTLKRTVIHTEFDPRIREREWSGWFGDHLAAPKDRAYKYFYRMSGGESCADVYTRITSFIESLRLDFDQMSSDNVLVISHGTAIRLFLQRWFRWDIDEYYTIQNPPNGGIIILERKFNEYELITEIKRATKGTVL